MCYPNDSLRIESKFKIIENQLEEVRRDQLNYKTEKDLIRETYSVNYDRINMGIVFILGVIGLIGYLGIKDINLIKKQYKTELEDLTKSRIDFDTKKKELETTKEKFDNSIKELLDKNKVQDNKLQLIDIKEKISRKLRDDEPTRALEYCSVALDLAPDDIDLLRSKSMIYNRLGKFSASKTTLNKALIIEPGNLSLSLDLIEILIFNQEIEEAQELMNKHKLDISKKSDGKLKIFYDMLISYINDNSDVLSENIINEIKKYDLEIKAPRITGWSVKEALYFAAYSKIDNKVDILRNYLWFKDGRISGKVAIERIEKMKPVAKPKEEDK